MYGVAKYLAGLLKPFVDNCENHVNTYFVYVEIVDMLRVAPDDILVSLTYSRFKKQLFRYTFR